MLSQDEIQALLVLRYYGEGPQMGVGTGFGGAPLSQLVNPPRRGQFRVGALGTSGTSISPDILKALFPIMQGRREAEAKRSAARMSNQQFVESLRGLSPEAQREAMFQRQNPEYFDVLEGRAKERRTAESEKTRNERERREALEAAEFSSALIEGRTQAGEERERGERETKLAALRRAMRPMAEAAPDIGAKAAALGRALPGGAMFLQTKADKKLYEELTAGGMPAEDIMTGEDVGEIEQQYSQYQTAREAALGPGVVVPPSMKIEHEPVTGAPTRFDFTPGALIRNEEDAAKFDQLVKIHKGDVTKAWSEFKSDAEKADARERDEVKAAETRATTITDKAVKERDKERDLKLDYVVADSEFRIAEDALKRFEEKTATTPAVEGESIFERQDREEKIAKEKAVLAGKRDAARAKRDGLKSLYDEWYGGGKGASGIATVGNTATRVSDAKRTRYLELAAKLEAGTLTSEEQSEGERLESEFEAAGMPEDQK